MKIGIGKKCALLALIALGCRSPYAFSATLEEVVHRHLDSLGTPEARQAIKSRAVQGTLRLKILGGRGTELTGTWGQVSEQRKSAFVLRFGSKGDWYGERFAFDGDKINVAAYTSSHRRSDFGEFISSRDFVVKEGLLGGELSAWWAMLNVDQLQGKLSYVGLKKIDGRELQALQYFAKGNGDMPVNLYFDPETYRHVMTVYSFSAAPNMGRSVLASPRQQEIRYTIEERFDDFKTEDGITLPHHYDLRYTEEPQSGATRFYDWEMTADKVINNVSLDPANFEAKQTK